MNPLQPPLETAMSAELVHSFLEINAKITPEKVALVHEDSRFTYRQINGMADMVASWLRQIAPGDRVAILLENGVQWVTSYFGVQKAGCVAVPLNCDLKREALAAILQQLQPRVLITATRWEKMIQEMCLQDFGTLAIVLQQPTAFWSGKGQTVAGWDDVVRNENCVQPNPAVPVGAADLSTIIFTSGSTGAPKGVMLSHRNIVSNTLSIVEYLELCDSDIQMVVLPFFYVMGMSLLNTHFAVGGSVVINNKLAYPASVLEQMVTEQVTGLSGVPSTYTHLLYRSPLAALRSSLQSLRYCTQAGGHMSREIKGKLLQTLPSHTKLYIMYGATEASARLTYVEPSQLIKKIDSIGMPIPRVTIKVLDENGAEVPCGKIGELVAQGPNIMQGYWKDPTSTSFVLDENGYHTGDLGYRDADGYLYVVGRKDAMLKVGGHRINPQEIEDVMIGTAMLLEVVVLGVQDELLGQRLVALAVPLTGIPEVRQILSYCLTHLPRYKIPSEIRYVPTLPKNANGKIDRMMCKKIFEKIMNPGSETEAVDILRFESASDA